MEWRLAMTMNDEGIIIGNNSHVHLMSNPSIDCVNPGLGQVVRMFDLYVPVHETKSINSINKVENKESVIEQSGAGNDQIDNESDESAKISQATNDSSLLKEDNKILPNNKRQINEIPNELEKSFQFPKIKTSQFFVEPPAKKIKKDSNRGHKFKVL